MSAVAVTRSASPLVRERLADLIDRLVMMLDVIDGDPDFEEGDPPEDDTEDLEHDGREFEPEDEDFQPWTPTEADALEELAHNADLIGRAPLACEVRWTLDRIRGGEARAA